MFFNPLPSPSLILDFFPQDVTDEYLDNMMNDAPGPINFTMFLTLFGERLQGTDPEDVIRNAFGCFDEENAGELSLMISRKSVAAPVLLPPAHSNRCELSPALSGTSVRYTG